MRKVGRMRACADCNMLFVQTLNKGYARCSKCYYKLHSPEHVESYVEYVLREVSWWMKYNRTHPPNF